jgi:hypothetical protein
MTTNYILVRIRENQTDGAFGTSVIRKAIHTAATEYGLNVADVPINENQPTTYMGKPQPYKEAEELMAILMPRKE